MDEASQRAATVSAFEEVPAALFVFEGPQHRVIAANRLARALVGDRSNLVGLPLREAVPELEGQQIFEILDLGFETRQPVTQPERRVLLDRNGDGSLEEGFFAWSFTPVELVTGERGTIVHAIETTDLVRQRQAAETRAAASERRYQEVRDVVLTLQQHMLPAGVPVLPRVRLSARYVVAAQDAAAGGDFFDAVPLTGGRVALLVGDVVGHGAAAAAVMGQLRAVALQALTSGIGITETVARLWQLATLLPAARGTTLWLSDFDPDTGHLRYVNCGHPPPLVLDLPAGARFLTSAPTTPLAIGDGPPAEGTDRLRPGQQLLLYSDGLVERAGRTLSDGLDDLARVALAAANDPIGPDTTLSPVLLDRICELVLERMGTQGYGDDVTLLAAELLPAPRSNLATVWPAEGRSLAQIRHAIRGWLVGLDVAPHDITTILHAVQEACANAIEHAYPENRSGTIHLACDLDLDGTLAITVTDRGRWRLPDADPGLRGRGLMLMRGLIESVEVTPSSSGTAVRLRHRLCRPVALGGSPPPIAGIHGEAVFATELIRGDEPVVTVAGPVDQTTVEKLRVAVLDAGRGGGLAITINLAEVTHLASAGLQLLHELDRTAKPPTGMRLVAPIGGPAHQVLTLTGLGHRISPARTSCEMS